MLEMPNQDHIKPSAAFVKLFIPGSVSLNKVMRFLLLLGSSSSTDSSGRAKLHYSYKSSSSSSSSSSSWWSCMMRCIKPS